MTHLKSILKPQNVQELPPNSTVAAAVEQMSSKHIGSVIIAEGTKILGIFTERDLLNRVIAHNKNPEKIHLKDVMTGNITTVTPETTVNECFNLMKEVGCRHLPVVEEGKVIAIVSIKHVLSWTIDALRYERDQLKQYIHN